MLFAFMNRLIRTLSALLLGAVLCGAACRRDEPSPAPNRPPGQDVWIGDDGRVPGQEPAPGPSDDQWEAMAAQARRSTSFEVYYADYRVYTVLRGDLAGAFGGREARYVIIVGYDGEADRFARYPAASDRWNLFFGTRAWALDLVNSVSALLQAAARRELTAAEQAELAALSARLAAEELAALSGLAVDLYAEVGGRRFLLSNLAAGAFADLPAPPAGVPR